MINYGKKLLQQARISEFELKHMLNLKLEEQMINLDKSYSYEPSIKIVNTFDLEQQTLQIEQKNRVMHALAHIEYNALKSYTDTIIRFIHQIPHGHQKEFKEDLGQIALEELKHFELADSLCKYGSQPVHKNLQDRIEQTNDSILGRLAIISIVNEGRGLDTGSNLLKKMDGDHIYENVLKTILKDEMNHVKIGLKWFNFLCGKTNPQEEFLRLMKTYDIKKTWKINIQKRKQAGYNNEWILCLQEWN